MTQAARIEAGFRRVVQLLKQRTGDLTTLLTTSKTSLVSAINELVNGKTYINVKDYGAIGDGVVDDTVAIQNAINFANTNALELYIPAGSYKITSALLINISNSTGSMPLTGGRRIIIRGQGSSNTNFIYAGTTAIIVFKIVGNIDGQDNLTISGLHITAASANASTRNSTGFEIRNLANFKISDITASFFNYGLKLFDSGEGIVEKSIFQYNNIGMYAAPDSVGIAPNGIEFNSCAFNSNLNVGAYILNGSTNSFIGCRVLQNGTNTTNRGIKIQYYSYTGGVGINMQGCYVEGNKGADVEVICASGGKHVLIGNTFNRTGDAYSTYNILFTPLI